MQFDYAPDSFVEQLNIDIRYCGYARHDAGWSETSFKASHDVWLLLEGCIHIKYEHHIYILNPGDAFLFSPNTQYDAWNEKDIGCKFMFIHFETHIGRSLKTTELFRIYGKADALCITDECEYLLSAHKKYIENKRETILILKASASLLISKIISVLGSIDDYFQDAPTDKYADFKNIFRYIDNNLHNDITVKELSDYSHMSEKYFITYFKKMVGVTPYKYVSMLKMKRAYVYLKSNNMSIKEIAEKLAYSDQYAFSKAFKKEFGFPPSRIIKTNNEQKL